MKRLALALLSAIVYADPCAPTDQTMLVIDDVGTVMGCHPGANPIAGGKCDNTGTAACIQQQADKEAAIAKEKAEEDRLKKEQQEEQDRLNTILRKKAERAARRKANGPRLTPAEEEEQRLARIAAWEAELATKKKAEDLSKCPNEATTGQKLWSKIYARIQEMPNHGTEHPTPDQLKSFRHQVCDMSCTKKGQKLEFTGKPSSENKYLNNLFSAAECVGKVPPSGDKFCTKAGSLIANADSGMC